MKWARAKNQLIPLMVTLLHGSLSVLFLTLLWNTVSCGKPTEDSEREAIQQGPDDSKVMATAAFGSQCPYGIPLDPQPVKVNLFECPAHQPVLEMTEFSSPYMVQADCKKKTISIRTVDRKVDATWEILPDGSFYVTLPTKNVRFKSDGQGNSDCSLPISTDFFGKLVCADRDKVNIHMEAIWWLGKKESPQPTSSVSPSPNVSTLPSVGPSFLPMPLASPSISPSANPRPSPNPGTLFSLTAVTVPSPTPTAINPNECKLPSTCYLHSKIEIRQCQ